MRPKRIDYRKMLIVNNWGIVLSYCFDIFELHIESAIFRDGNY